MNRQCAAALILIPGTHVCNPHNMGANHFYLRREAMHFYAAFVPGTALHEKPLAARRGIYYYGFAFLYYMESTRKDLLNYYDENNA
jgi:hypothetical protein